jgi:hypothetical protein
VPISLDINSLTVRETEEFCAALGVKDLRQLQKFGDQIPPEMLAPVAWLAKKKTDPTFTLEQAKDLTMAEIIELFGGLVPNAGTGSSATS